MDVRRRSLHCTFDVHKGKRYTARVKIAIADFTVQHFIRPSLQRKTLLRCGLRVALTLGSLRKRKGMQGSPLYLRGVLSARPTFGQLANKNQKNWPSFLALGGQLARMANKKLPRRRPRAASNNAVFSSPSSLELCNVSTHLESLRAAPPFSVDTCARRKRYQRPSPHPYPPSSA